MRLCEVPRTEHTGYYSRRYDMRFGQLPLPNRLIAPVGDGGSQAAAILHSSIALPPDLEMHGSRHRFNANP
jgi:hypothetical protein